MIEVEGLRKSFGSVVAVEGISFRAGNGVVTGLLGPNGAGKTTTLRMLTTLLAPDSGSCRVDGLDVFRHPMASRKRLGVLPDVHGHYPRLTPREHVGYFDELHGIDPRRADERCDALFQLLNLPYS